MCDTMTSHLYHITNGPVVHTLWGHSETRQALEIGDKDENYVEVEWRENKTAPNIRFPDSWRQSSRDECNTFYSKFDTPEDLIRFLLPLAVKIRVVPGKEHLISKISKKATYVDLQGCTGLKTVPNFPNATGVDLEGCTGLKTVPNFPSATYVYLEGCTGLKTVPDFPNAIAVYLPDHLKK